MTRTDNDTWDLATGVGTTATGVAAIRALASTGPRPLFTDPYARPLVEAVGLAEYVRLADGFTEQEGIDPASAADGMAVRTQFFDEFFRDASAAGVRQAVILASGLDTRAHRVDWPAGTTVFELDQPAVIDFKVATLAGLGAHPAAELHSIGIDLRQDWPTALRNRGFDASRPTAWIAEGLLGYLPPEAQDRLFDLIAELSAPGSRLAADWNPASADLDGEFSDLLYSGERHDVGDYLAAHGWTVQTDPAERRFVANGLAFPRTDVLAGLHNVNHTVAIR
jgi:methyltransferase (TIGR00027 family)